MKRDEVPGLAERLVQARLSKGLTTQNLSKASGIEHHKIQSFETGKHTPTLASLYKLAKGLGVKIEELLPKNDQTV